MHEHLQCEHAHFGPRAASFALEAAQLKHQVPVTSPRLRRLQSSPPTYQHCGLNPNWEESNSGCLVLT